MQKLVVYECHCVLEYHFYELLLMKYNLYGFRSSYRTPQYIHRRIHL